MRDSKIGAKVAQVGVFGVACFEKHGLGGCLGLGARLVFGVIVDCGEYIVVENDLASKQGCEKASKAKQASKQASKQRKQASMYARMHASKHACMHACMQASKHACMHASNWVVVCNCAYIAYNNVLIAPDYR